MTDSLPHDMSLLEARLRGTLAISWHRVFVNPAALLRGGSGKDACGNAIQGDLGMRTALIACLLIGLLAGFMLSGRVATSQEEPFAVPNPEGRGRFQIAGHSTYPPLLLDSETGTSWILMSTSDGEARHWVWEPIEAGILEPGTSPGLGRDMAQLPAPPLTTRRKLVASKSRPFVW
jgi:hypothetical protein